MEDTHAQATAHGLAHARIRYNSFDYTSSGLPSLDLEVDGDLYAAVPVGWLWLASQDGLLRILIKNCMRVDGKVRLTMNRAPGAFQVVMTVLQHLAANLGKDARDLLVLNEVEREEIRFYGILPKGEIDLVRSAEDNAQGACDPPQEDSRV